MVPVRSLEPKAAKRLFFAILCCWLILLTFWVNHFLAGFQARGGKTEPFGIFRQPNGAVYAQDFSYNLLYLEGIRHHEMAHPYRMADQEKFMRRRLPECGIGMTHAYSPVALVLAEPLLHVSGRARYAIYTLLCAAGLILLFKYVLLPPVETTGQLVALAIIAMSVCLLLNFALGQSALFTTPLLGALWLLLQRRERGDGARFLFDLGLALLFWALCLKPNVAVVPAALLLGARAWRPLVLVGFFLVLTWALVSGHYGGWWTGLTDYAHLLNHYNGADMTPFMQRPSGSTDSSSFAALTGPAMARRMFSFDRSFLLISIAVLLLLRWKNRLTASDYFQAVIAVFLLVSPYLLPSEDLILLLLVGEGSFFKTGKAATQLGKLLVLFGIMDLRVRVTFPIDLNYLFRAILFTWMLVEAWRAKRNLAVAPATPLTDFEAPT